MPWQPFRRKVKHKPLENEPTTMETSFDGHEMLPRSVSDGNLVRTSSERFLLSSYSAGRRSYGTCSASSALWTSFVEHTVDPGDTIQGLALRFNITVQDLKLANKLWTNEGLWPGRVLRVPVIEASSTSLDLSGSSGCSDTMSTASSSGATSSGASSRRLSSHDSLLHTSVSSAGNSPLTKPSSSNSSPFNKGLTMTTPVRRASVEELQDFLSKMDSNIANSKKATATMIKKSSISDESATTTTHQQHHHPASTTTTTAAVLFANNNRSHPMC